MGLYVLTVKDKTGKEELAGTFPTGASVARMIHGVTAASHEKHKPSLVDRILRKQPVDKSKDLEIIGKWDRGAEKEVIAISTGVIFTIVRAEGIHVKELTF